MHNIIQEVFKWQCKLTSLYQSNAIFAGVVIIFKKKSQTQYLFSMKQQ